MSAKHIAAIALLITALTSAGGLIIGVWNAREIKIIHFTINSRMDQLLDTAREGALAKGLKQGREETKRD